VFVAAIDDLSRIRRSRDVSAHVGLVRRRYQSGEVDYVGGILKCVDRRVRTLLCEAANVIAASGLSLLDIVPTS
jgi:transposase